MSNFAKVFNIASIIFVLFTAICLSPACAFVYERACVIELARAYMSVFVVRITRQHSGGKTRVDRKTAEK